MAAVCLSLSLSQAVFTSDHGFLEGTDGYGLAHDTVAVSGFGGCWVGCPAQDSKGQDGPAQRLHGCQAPLD